MRAYGIILSDTYFDKINEIRRLHYLGNWTGAEKVVEECRYLTLTCETKELGLSSDDEISSTAHIELYVAVALRNCSGYITRKMMSEVTRVKERGDTLAGDTLARRHTSGTPASKRYCELTKQGMKKESHLERFWWLDS